MKNVLLATLAALTFSLNAFAIPMSLKETISEYVSTGDEAVQRYLIEAIVEGTNRKYIIDVATEMQHRLQRDARTNRSYEGPFPRHFYQDKEYEHAAFLEVRVNRIQTLARWARIPIPDCDATLTSRR